MEAHSQPGARFWTRAAIAVAAHPSLWATAVVQALRCAPPGWWRRPPYLPRPDAAYTAFRLTTQYGTDAEPDPADLVIYLAWCRDEVRGRRGGDGDQSIVGGLVRHRR